jgi:hypothetical protein
MSIWYFYPPWYLLFFVVVNFLVFHEAKNIYMVGWVDCGEANILIEQEEGKIIYMWVFIIRTIYQILAY